MFWYHPHHVCLPALLLFAQRGHPREDLALEELEGGATPGGDVRNLVLRAPLDAARRGVAAPDDRQDRRQERGRSDERQDKRECRHEEGAVGKDKRDCKQEEVRDGVRGNQGERLGDDDDNDKDD